MYILQSTDVCPHTEVAAALWEILLLLTSAPDLLNQQMSLKRGPFSVVSCEVMPNAVCLIGVPGYSLHHGTSAPI